MKNKYIPIGFAMPLLFIAIGFSLILRSSIDSLYISMSERQNQILRIQHNIIDSIFLRLQEQNHNMHLIQDNEQRLFAIDTTFLNYMQKHP